MAPLPQNGTPRLRCHYEGPFGQHVMLFRGPNGGTTTDLAISARVVIFQMTDLQYNDTQWGSAEAADEGSDLFFPVSGWTPLTSVSGANPGANNGIARFLEFGGRSSGGRRAKFYLFEVAQQEDADYKVPYGSVTPIDQVIDAFNDEDTELAAIDGNLIVAYPYANIGDNDYWVHKARRGS